MRETTDPLAERVRAAGPGVAALVAEAERVWRDRAGSAGGRGLPGGPVWRPFEDAFPTFYQFTNRPR